MYWDNLEDNAVIQSHIDTWRRYVPSDWVINVITKNNIHDYADAEFISKYENLDPVRFSDFFRFFKIIFVNKKRWCVD